MNFSRRALAQRRAGNVNSAEFGAPAWMKLITTFPLEHYDLSPREPVRAAGSIRRAPILLRRRTQSHVALRADCEPGAPS